MLAASIDAQRGRTMSRLALPAAALLTLAAGVAQAHTGIGAAGGFGYGFAHPLGGLDHVLAMVAGGVLAAQLGPRALRLGALSFFAMMVVCGGAALTGVRLAVGGVAVGVLAAQLGPRALRLVPLSFIAMMIVGGALAMTGISLPLVETAIGLSVVAFGLAVAAGYRLPASTAMALAGFFALFHGYAHGAETPGSLSGLDYAAGFVLATALLHVAGAGTAITAAKLGHVFGERALRS